MPASAFLSSDTADTVLQRLRKYTCSELCVEVAQRKSTVSCFFPVVHPHLYVRPRNICFNGCLQTTDCLFNDVQKGLWGGNFFGSVLGPGFSWFQWAGAPSEMKITWSSGLRLSRASRRKSLNRSAFISPYNDSVVHNPELQNHFYFEISFCWMHVMGAQLFVGSHYSLLGSRWSLHGNVIECYSLWWESYWVRCAFGMIVCSRTC